MKADAIIKWFMPKEERFHELLGRGAVNLGDAAKEFAALAHSEDFAVRKAHTQKLRETIGGHAQVLLEALRVRFEQGNEDKESLITEIHQQLGDSVEKLLLIKVILDSDPQDNKREQG